jgi:hypothetical protein
MTSTSSRGLDDGPENHGLDLLEEVNLKDFQAAPQVLQPFQSSILHWQAEDRVKAAFTSGIGTLAARINAFFEKEEQVRIAKPQDSEKHQVRILLASSGNCGGGPLPCAAAWNYRYVRERE